MMITKQEEISGKINEMINSYGANRDSLLPILQEVQKQYRSIDDFSMQIIADRLGIHPAEVYGVVTFFSFLNESYHGRFVIRLCRTASCDMQGKEAVARQLKNDLGINFGETTSDGRFTLEWANCIGMCDQGPAMLVNDQVYTRVTPEKVNTILSVCRNVFNVNSIQSEEEHVL
jgi:NADH:ubiquinone oxidoreductase subunit E